MHNNDIFFKTFIPIKNTKKQPDRNEVRNYERKYSKGIVN